MIIEEQENVINSKNKNIIVSASAGSGKTTVMIRKLIDTVCQSQSDTGANINEILVLTYTDATAEELRAKVEKKLRENLSKNPSLQKQIDLLPLADISTFHSFCQKLIKKYFYILGISPNMRVIVNEEQTSLKSQALENTIKNYKHANECDFIKLNTFYDSKGKTKELEKIILSLADFFESQPNNILWQKTTLKKLYADKNFCENYLYNYIIDELKPFLLKFNDLIIECEQANCKKYSTYLYSLYNIAKNLCSNKNFISLYSQINSNLSFDKQPTLSKNEEQSDLKEKVSEIKTDFKKCIEGIKTKLNFGEDYCYDAMRENSLFILDKICELTNLYTHEYSRLKTEKTCLDYADMEKYVIDILSSSEVCEELKNTYKYIYIDEYQDANYVQENIISKISRQNNRFMVGDVKQSIYGFRESRPEIFLQKVKDYKNLDDSQELHLNSNFRSDKRILDFVNKVFSVIMTDATTAIDYKTNDLLDGKKTYENKAGDTAVEIDIAIIKPEDELKNLPKCVYSVKNDNQNLLENSGDDDLSSIDKQIQIVAEKISSIVAGDIYDAETQSWRKAKFNDICILVRNRTNMQDIFNGLSSYGIPTIVKSTDNIVQASEVVTLIDILSLCSNPCNDTALASVLTSFFGGLSYQDLYSIRLSSKENFFYQCAREYVLIHDDEISSKLTKAKKIVDDLRANISLQTVFDALNNLVLTSGYLTYILSLTNGEICKYRVQCFLDYLKSKPDSGLNSILSLLSSNDTKISLPSIISPESDCVNLTTMHSSKGLEFPVVILFNSTADFTKKPPQKDNININSDLGVGVKYYSSKDTSFYETPQDIIIKLENNKRDFAENIRLLYVALTRAKNKLYIVGAVNEKKVWSKIETYKDIKSKNTFLDLIVCSLDSCEITKANMRENLYNNGKLSINFYDNFCINQAENLEVEHKTDKLIEVLNNVENLSKRQTTSVALKNTVTKILQSAQDNNDEEKFILRENYFLKNINTSSSSLADIGTTYHKFLEILNFSKIIDLKTLNEEIESCKSLCIINEEDIKNIDKNILLKNIVLINSIILLPAKLIKEKEFMMYLPYSQLINSNVNDKVLVQGKIDLIVLGENPIIIDYKYSNLSSKKLAEKYELQLKLYKTALQKFLMIDNIDCYLLSLKNAEIIKIN